MIEIKTSGKVELDQSTTIIKEKYKNIMKQDLGFLKITEVTSREVLDGLWKEILKF